MEKYDLFNTREAAELYATKQPELGHKVIEFVLKHSRGRDLLIDVGLLLICLLKFTILVFLDYNFYLSFDNY